MLKVIIEAFNGLGKEKVKAGEREVQKPETLDEARTVDSDADILEYYWSSKTIEIQRQIRAGTTVSAKNQLSAILAAAKNNPELAKTLEALKIVVESKPTEAGNGEENKGGEAQEEAAPSAPPAEAPKPTARGRRS